MNEIASRRPGSSVRLGYMRDGKQADATVTIGDRDKVFADLGSQQAEANPDEKGDAGEAKLGIVVREESPATAAKLHTPGVVIQSVRSGSFADLQGLGARPGDHAHQQAADRHQGAVRCRGEQAQDRRRRGL